MTRSHAAGPLVFPCLLLVGVSACDSQSECVSERCVVTHEYEGFRKTGSQWSCEPEVCSCGRTYSQQYGGPGGAVRRETVCRCSGACEEDEAVGEIPLPNPADYADYHVPELATGVIEVKFDGDPAAFLAVQFFDVATIGLLVDVRVDGKSGHLDGLVVLCGAWCPDGETFCEAEDVGPLELSTLPAVHVTGRAQTRPGDDGWWLELGPFDYEFPFDNIFGEGPTTMTLAGMRLSGVLSGTPALHVREDPGEGPQSWGSFITYTGVSNSSDTFPLAGTWTARELDEGAVPHGMPRLCATAPCAAENDEARDCVLAADWPPVTCGEDQ